MFFQKNKIENRNICIDNIINVKTSKVVNKIINSKLTSMYNKLCNKKMV